VTTWQHRTVVVRVGDDRLVDTLGGEGWEPYAAMPAEQYGGNMGALNVDRMIVLLRRPTT
jgi:hypothetical protein